MQREDRISYANCIRVLVLFCLRYIYTELGLYALLKPALLSQAISGYVFSVYVKCVYVKCVCVCVCVKCGLALQASLDCLTAVKLGCCSLSHAMLMLLPYSSLESVCHRRV